MTTDLEQIEVSQTLSSSYIGSVSSHEPAPKSQKPTDRPGRPHYDVEDAVTVTYKGRVWNSYHFRFGVHQAAISLIVRGATKFWRSQVSHARGVGTDIGRSLFYPFQELAGEEQGVGQTLSHLARHVRTTDDYGRLLISHVCLLRSRWAAIEPIAGHEYFSA